MHHTFAEYSLLPAVFTVRIADVSLDPSHITSLIPILQTLLADRNPLVLGTALAALESIAPGRNDLLHGQYRRLCRSLVDTDEWSQVVMLRVLERYARCEFADPEGKGSKVSLDIKGNLLEARADL